MSRTVSARIPTELHEELRERCNLIGESINDFVKASIEIGLYGTTDFNFEDEEEIKDSDEKIDVIENSEKTKSSELQNIRISYNDGKTWHSTKDLGVEMT